MTWVLVHDGAVVASGSYGAMLDAAEEWAVCARARHPDGTELAPRLAPGWSILPEAMVATFSRRAA